MRWFLLLLPLSLFAADSRLVVGHFSAGELAGWEVKRFAGETDYRLVEDGGREVLRAESRGAASGRYRRIEVALDKRPILNWSWRVGNLLPGRDERTKKGDDYPARIYVVFSGGLAFWRTRAINYVWSSNQQPGSRWDNAFTANARMIAVEGGGAKLGQWISERRNVAEDYKLLFGEDIDKIDAVAIMTDTDNSGGEATAWYGDIWFSAE